ncbi:MAG: hypothetical protein IPL59_00730 [Candidatus Competibacteraceae bacterium]|uniref:Uncharacterized protein n=1 Tax=Candidatus Contendobacter odensis Run_B_J11 TaxID=1400861 RepID=A0A7U7GEX0_9GAMM|nr:hypothetical protein [Candidatus Contendobacter odensis]MBK8533749.1 hypothetical protein [Candidatus Competibacteraceae bacterium]MBK8754110.1 hypothetical protein [Candidatus Competibacteraceae bacterium]CDH46859.1 hypothetical protein BN874_630005 [Candidatus Contendobacter odensis Run_B_J11]
MLQTIATVPTPHMIELLELIERADRHDVEPRLTHYLNHCRRTGYEPPVELLQMARDHIGRKRGVAEPPHRFRRRASDRVPATLDCCGSN